MAYKDYINHNSFGLSWKHKELPIVAQTGFDFYRYVTFTDDMYGKTISELHQGNLRAVTNNNRYADLFEGDKVSYWAATPLIARREWQKHNQGEANHLMFWAYDDVSNTFPTIRKPKIKTPEIPHLPATLKHFLLQTASAEIEIPHSVTQKFNLLLSQVGRSKHYTTRLANS